MSAHSGPSDSWTEGTDRGRTHIATKGIVQSGLVLNLDAGVSSSYPGFGTTWYDLSGSNNHVTLNNGPTFSSTNSGIITFDGANDYGEVVTRNTNLEFQPNSSFTLCVWIKTTNTPGVGAIIANMFNAGPYPGYDLWFNSNNQIACHLIQTWSADAIKVRIEYPYTNFTSKWNYVCVSYNGSTPLTVESTLDSINFYTDGALNTTGKLLDGTDGFNANPTTITYNTSQRFRIASRWTSNAITSGIQGSIPSVMVYNKALTAAEIKQNFNATRNRYGI